MGIQERYDVFISHYPTAQTNPYIEAMCTHLRRMGLLVWVDMKRKNGINKAMMAAIDNSSIFLAVVTPEYMDLVHEGELERRKRSTAIAPVESKRTRDRSKDEDKTANDHTCELQLYYACKRKEQFRILPVLTDDAASAGWRAVDSSTLEIHVDYGEDGGFDLDEDEKAELKAIATKKAYDIAVEKVKADAGWKGTIGKILAVQPKNRQLVVSLHALQQALRVVQQLEEERKERERQDLKRQMKREKAERKAASAGQSKAVKELNRQLSRAGSRPVSSGTDGVSSENRINATNVSKNEIIGSSNQDNAVTENSAIVSAKATDTAESQLPGEQRNAVESTEDSGHQATKTKALVNPVRVIPPPLPYPIDCLFMIQLQLLYRVINKLLLEAACPLPVPQDTSNITVDGYSSAEERASHTTVIPHGIKTHDSLEGRNVGSVIPLQDLSCNDISTLLSHLHMSMYLEELHEKEVNGLTLSMCEGVGDVEELGVRVRAKARELLHHIKTFKIAGGVPQRLLVMSTSQQQQFEGQGSKYSSS